MLGPGLELQNHARIRFGEEIKQQHCLTRENRRADMRVVAREDTEVSIEREDRSYS